MPYEYELDGIYVESEIPIEEWDYGTQIIVVGTMKEDPVIKYLAPLCDTVIRME